MKSLKIIDAIDAYFEEKSLKEEMIFYALIVLVIGFVIIYFWLPSIQSEEARIKKQYITLERTYNNLRRDYKIKAAQIVSLNQKIQQLKFDIKRMSNKVDMYNEMAKSLYYTLFDRYKWGEFMQSLVKRAKNNNLEIVNISNILFDEKGAIITKKLEVDLELKGGYKNLIKFIYSYENTKDLLRVEDLEISDKRDYIVKFIFYGVNP